MKSDLIDQDEKKRILRERALKLAVEAAAVSESEVIEVLEFLLDRERYGIESQYIREVYPLKSFTRVPCSPSYVTGVINLRGQIISIIDIREFFGIKGKGLSDLNKVIILHSADMEFGILADEILGVKIKFIEELGTALPALTDLRTDYIKGVTKERLIILDGGKILEDKGLIVNEEVKV